jgi:twitching motility protein PilT
MEKGELLSKSGDTQIGGMSVIDFLTAVISSSVQVKASDIHVRTGSPVMIRVDGSIRSMKGSPTLSADDLNFLVELMLGRHDSAEFDKKHQFDAAVTDKNGNRVRANIYRQMGVTAIVMRIIVPDIPTPGELGLPKEVQEISSLENGLVIFSGATGSGKSTTMASLLNEINHSRRKHILTIEDPVEFVFENDKCFFSQRQIGMDVPNFEDAMKAALREDPDIILLGEMRDAVSIETALNAAETGHLVFSTLHAPTAADVVTRMVSSFSGEAQATIRTKLAQNLRVVATQRLLPRSNGGRIAACEVMTVSARVSELILDPLKIKEVEDLVKGGDTVEGMLHFDDHLLQLVEAEVINKEVALQYSSSATDLGLKLKGF